MAWKEKKRREGLFLFVVGRLERSLMLGFGLLGYQVISGGNFLLMVIINRPTMRKTLPSNAFKGHEPPHHQTMSKIDGGPHR